MKIKIKNTILFILLSFMLGAIAGAIIWAVLKIMSLGIGFVWDWLPKQLGHNNIYTIVICLCGGLIIGLVQKKYGVLPETLETVMSKVKKEGTYDYSKLHILVITALLPLIFGGSLGPEAGLTGLIVGLCCWFGDRLKYKTVEIREFASVGMAASLGVIFNAPLFGLVNNFENNPNEKIFNESKPIFSEKEKKKLKPVIYIVGILGGFLTMEILKFLFGGSLGLPRFSRLAEELTVHDWTWMILFIIIGIGCGFFYTLLDKITKDLAKPLEKKRIISCLIGGVCLAAFAVILPWTMFSGETEMGEMISCWQQLSIATLICSALGKIVLINLCINFGWRGGNIFPLIFAGVSMGYGLVTLTGINSVFGVALVASALCGYVMRKPVTVIAILMLCFPIVMIIPIGISAFFASLVPRPFKNSREEEK